MTVSELIAVLIHMDMDAQVLVWDYNPGEGWFKAVIHGAEERPSEVIPGTKEVHIA